MLFVSLIAVFVALFAVVGPARAATTFTVTNTNDSGAGSLRQAITDANANGNPTEADTIEFDIPAAQCVTATDVCTISPASQLPNINQSVTIDGYTQTGASPNTIENGPTPDAANTGSNAQIKIELNGVNSGRADGLRVIGTSDVPVNDVTIKGLAINRFQDDGIQAEDATDITIEGNHIGTDAAGAQAFGNGFGLFIVSTSDSQVGGATPAARNVVAASRTDNVLTSSTSNMTIQNNYVGTDADGTLDFGSGDDGTDINGAGSGSLIGGASPAARNVFFGSSDAGMELFTGITGLRVVGNSVSGNTNQGVDLTTNSVDGVSILTNSISDNGIGIRLAAGANNNQTRPVLTSATNTGGETDAAVVEGTLDSTPNATFTVQFFSNETADPSGFGEGEVYEGQTTSVTTNADGDATFSAPTDSPVEAGRVITATATNNTTGDTSEFSNGVETTGDIADVSIEKEAPQAVAVGDRFDYTLTVTNSGPDTATDVTVTDELPEQVEFISASEGCTDQSGTVTCDVGDLGTTAPNNTGEITISVRAVSTGDAENTATVDSETADLDNDNDSDTAITTSNACTVTGTNRRDTLKGTPRRDVICGLGGNDSIRGLGGDDIILSGSGNDSVDGGDGKDAIYGGTENDILSGGAGNDELYGEAGNDRLIGGPGQDKLDGGPGDNRLEQ